MKHLSLVIVILAFAIQASAQDVRPVFEKQFTPEGDVIFHQLIDFDDVHFYAARFVKLKNNQVLRFDKVNKKTFQSSSSKEINYGTKAVTVKKIIKLLDRVYIFTSVSTNKSVELVYHFINSAGEIQAGESPLLQISSSPGRKVDIDILKTSSDKTILIKASYIAQGGSAYTTDFILTKSDDMRIKWKKTTQHRLFSNSIDDAAELIEGSGENFLDYFIDANDNLLFAYSIKNKVVVGIFSKTTLSTAASGIGSDGSAEFEFLLDSNYAATGMRFLESGKSVLMGGGIFALRKNMNTDVKGHAGFFSFTFNTARLFDLSDFKLNPNPVTFFPDQMETDLEISGQGDISYGYKMDHVIPVDDGFLLTGQQYDIHMGKGSNVISYRDIIGVKIDIKGSPAWMVNLPFRNHIVSESRKLVIPYAIQTGLKNVFILYNDQPENRHMYFGNQYIPSNMKYISEESGSNFDFVSLNTVTGTTAGKTLLKNQLVPFQYMEDNKIEDAFVPSKVSVHLGNNMIIYRNEEKLKKFVKLSFIE